METREDTALQSDETLLSLFVKGSEAALGELASRHERRLLGLALGLCSQNESLAREAVQETWVRVIRHAGAFRGQSSFATWVYRITVNQCRTLMSRERRKVMPEHRGVTTSADANLRASEEKRWVLSALDTLHPRDREIVLLCHMRGMTHEQAAAVLEIPVGTLKTRMTRAMKTLRAQAASEVDP